jgi:hypothetical protein
MKNNQETWRFFVQVLFSAIVLTFSLYKLSGNDQQESYQALYWGGVTGIMAWWMPSPGSGTSNGSNSQNDSQSGQIQLLPPATAKANGKPPMPAPVNVQSLPQKTA